MVCSGSLIGSFRQHRTFIEANLIDRLRSTFAVASAAVRTQKPPLRAPFRLPTSDIHSSVIDQPIALLKWRKLDKAVVEGEPFKLRLPTEAASRKFAEAVNAQCKVWN
jgi:hypothetical protein